MPEALYARVLALNQQKPRPEASVGFRPQGAARLRAMIIIDTRAPHRIDFAAKSSLVFTQ
jgi:hypothetical protein